MNIIIKSKNVRYIRSTKGPLVMLLQLKTLYIYKCRRLVCLGSSTNPSSSLA